MSLCQTCILPGETVSLDANGNCDLCRTDNGRVHYRGEAALVDLLERHRRIARARGARYDCLVAVSGGKDSTYALLQLVRKYSVHPVAFYYEHGYADGQAHRNLLEATGKLKVDLVCNSDHRMQHRYLRRNLRRLVSLRPEQVLRLWRVLCVGCRAGYAKAANRYARAHGISLVVQGGCPVEPDMLALALEPRFKGRPRVRALLEMLKVSGREVYDILTTPFFWNPLYYRNAVEYLAVTGYLLRRLTPRFRRPPDPQRAQFFDYIEWDEDRIVSTLERELGWRRSQGRSTTARFDCRLHLLRDLWCLATLGCSDKEAMYSAMIRKGMISRQEALRRAEEETSEERFLVGQVLDELMATLGGFPDAQRVGAQWKALLGIGHVAPEAGSPHRPA